MSTLLVWKDQIEKIYARYSFYIVKILQFVLGLCVFGLINSNIGFMKALSSTVCTVGLAAVTAFLPVGMLALVAALLVLVHLYALSLPVAGLCLAIFLVMYIFYVRFTPKKSWLVVVAAVAVALKVPYVIPVVFGLLGAPSFAVSMMLGTIVYYMLHTVKLTASAFQSGGVKELLDGIMVFTKQILANKEMWMMPDWNAVFFQSETDQCRSLYLPAPALQFSYAFPELFLHGSVFWQVFCIKSH